MFLRVKCAAVALVVMALFSAVARAAPEDYSADLSADAKGAADSAYTGRYEGSTIVAQTTRVFEELILPAGPADVKAKSFTQTVAQKGKVLRTLYVSPEERSSLEVFGNYVDALKAKGFSAVFECDNASCGANFKSLKYIPSNPASVVISEGASTRREFLSRGMFNKIVDPRYALLKTGTTGQETYVAVFAARNEGGSMGDVSKALRGRVGVLVEVVEAGQREDKIVTLSADEIGNGMGANGHVVFYGLYFDFDKATIKPESDAQLKEMVAYLNSDGKRRVFVVGHTDNTGEVDYNVKLSSARAVAVVAALQAAGIDGGRLMAKGVGPFAPLASNDSEEGQAKNRRVELVAR